jgi:hypothetical protein
MVQQNSVESALEMLRPGLAADGFDLRAGVLEDNDVQVILAARPDACLDCLVPDDLMIQIIDDSIRRQDPSLGAVELVREGFEAITEH